MLDCSNISTTIDPFWDISLDLGMGPSVRNGGSAMLSPSYTEPTSLFDCLKRFTRDEHLGSFAKIKCSQCTVHRESTKRLTMKRLPIVCCFHLKVSIHVVVVLGGCGAYCVHCRGFDVADKLCFVLWTI